MLGLILSIIALIAAMFIPLLGFVLGVIALIIGIKNKKDNIKYSTAVIVISIIALVYGGLGFIIEASWGNVTNSINQTWGNN